jgi:recombination protein RecA
LDRVSLSSGPDKGGHNDVPDTARPPGVPGATNPNGKVKAKPPKGGSVTKPAPPKPEPEMPSRAFEVEFFTSGATLLDLALGGGWAHGRVVNVVGDRSTGKTLIAIEAAAGFIRTIKGGHVRYLEAESAFSKDYARRIGLNPDRYYLKQDIDVVEGFYEDLEETITKSQGKAKKVQGTENKFYYPDAKPLLYIIDSIDALSTEAEFTRDIHKEDVIASKARELSKIFRKVVRRMNVSDTTLLIVSQVRANIGAQFGGKTKSTGNAINFYNSQEMWLFEEKKIEKTYRGQKRALGLEVRARNKKNKVGAPYREAPLEIIFEYGIDDEISNLRWLKSAQVSDIEGVKLEELEGHIRSLRDDRNFAELKPLSALIKTETQKLWAEIEERMAPTIHKDELL